MLKPSGMTAGAAVANDGYKQAPDAQSRPGRDAKLGRGVPNGFVTVAQPLHNLPPICSGRRQLPGPIVPKDVLRPVAFTLISE